MNKLNWYWFSFSFGGKNQGVCVVESETEKTALQKTIDLGIHPKHDDIKAYRMNVQELPKPNKLYTRKEMINLGY